MSCLVQQPAPEFEAQAVMPDGSFETISLASYQGKYVILFFYPLDFTFVCPTEIIAFSEAVGKFGDLPGGMSPGIRAVWAKSSTRWWPT